MKGGDGFSPDPVLYTVVKLAETPLTVKAKFKSEVVFTKFGPSVPVLFKKIAFKSKILLLFMDVT